ncbi:aminotransferase [Clostridium sp. P21]|uniref:Aminotransferase n=1 Tax=Clostridium muellerianum TaxID=2716538 RepID=A0A7Y0HNG7_9CLOT|nr:aminotransferase [Clostridium muellerianum]NMM64004.1 aminotransferase [Clostridium muellerianum]
MKIKPFGVEMYMNAYENDCEYNLAETCVESLTVDELLKMSGKKDEIINEIVNMKLTYGAIEGSMPLRTAISQLYKNVNVENITITHGAIGANSLAIETLVEPGDRVISVLPTYQQHYSIPESIGADVKILKLREENDFLPNLDELKSFINDKTKLICINNPNNPTGALMDKEFLMKIVEIAKTCGAYVLSDEVYRGLNQEGDSFTESIADLYEKGISTASMSKTFSLAGLRLGWIAGPVEFISEVNKHRDYNTISVGMIDDKLATVALENKDKIIKRNIGMVRNNLKILDDWIAKEPKFSYVKPKSGTTALLKYDFDMSSEHFCLKLLREKGVMLLPGSVMDMEGYLRIGYTNNPKILKEGLAKISEFMSELKK